VLVYVQGPLFITYEAIFITTHPLRVIWYASTYGEQAEVYFHVMLLK
jgi:TorA maturation chaperone TorD